MNKFSDIAMAAAAAASASASPVAQPAAEPEISISELSPNRFELVYSASKFTSRDEPERELLLSSARLSLAHDQASFVLLAMPGERQDVHPARPNPAFGAKYGHWQPHWNYYLAKHGWQWWHPEWGAEFWTKDVDPKSIERIQVHAMVDLGPTVGSADEGLGFNASDVVRDLSRPLGVPRPTTGIDLDTVSRCRRTP